MTGEYQGHCREGDKCVCGGDLPQVRAGCGSWVAAAEMSDSFIDYHLNVILMASGSALRHYSMHKTKDDMRTALRVAIRAAAIEQQKGGTK